MSSAVVVMDAGKELPNIETAIQRSIISLSQITRDFFTKGIELERICRTAMLLKESGVNPDIVLYRKLAEKCVDLQRNDGGWTDVVETMWCTAFLNLFGEFSYHADKSLKWLKGQKDKDGGWGKSKRDLPRIPVTGLLLYLLPQLSLDRDLKWLENKWNQEQELEPCLTYKAAFTMMAFSRNDYHPEKQDFITETIHWLSGQQNDDGGWGPWKGHPVGSDPWCTGISLMGLLQYPCKTPQKIFLKAMKWLIKKQLPNGLWSCHYIEEGSSWAIYAMVSVYSNKQKRC
ncbi:hypothetical protein ES705_36505 [subsurface metagenome]